jgi:Protein of unknown function (DUF2817)
MNKEFKNSYEECRENFLRKVSRHPVKSVQVPTRVDPLLFTDFVHLPATGTPKKLLVLTSGLHGVEGFVGSAMQNFLLENNFFGERKEDTGILLIHAINPYGFKYLRRVSENNVDLNRNFDVSEDLFKVRNPSYQLIESFLNPTLKVRKSPFAKAFFFAKGALKIFKYSLEALRRGMLGGQYDFSEGVFFGGSTFEPHKAILEKELLEVATDYEALVLIDLHTGYGERGKLHILSNGNSASLDSYTSQIFQGCPIDFGRTKDFYEVSGGFVDYVGKIFAGKKKFSGVYFEFGTLDSQRSFGSLEMAFRMVRENQLAHFGSTDPESESFYKKEFLEMFYPESEAWRESVSRQFENLMKTVLRKM